MKYKYVIGIQIKLKVNSLKITIKVINRYKNTKKKRIQISNIRHKKETKIIPISNDKSIS